MVSVVQLTCRTIQCSCCHILSYSILCPRRNGRSLLRAGKPSWASGYSLGFGGRPQFSSFLCGPVGLRATCFIFLNLSFFIFKMGLTLGTTLKGYFAVPGA